MKSFVEMIDEGLQNDASPGAYGKPENNPKIKAYMAKGYNISGKPQLAADGKKFIVTVMKDGKSIEVQI